MEVILTDKGTSPLSSSSTITIHVLDANDNDPYVKYPNNNNHTVSILWSQEPSQTIATVQAFDIDEGDNARLTYYLYATSGPDVINDLFQVIWSI